jgi:hypothetical protein
MIVPHRGIWASSFRLPERTGGFITPEPPPPDCIPDSFTLNTANIDSGTKSFDGGDFLDVGTNNFSTVMWFKSSSDNEEYLTKEGDGDSQYWYFRMDSICRPAIAVYTATGHRVFRADSPITCDGVWHQVITYVDRATSSVTFYVDGVLRGNTTASSSGTITGDCTNSSNFRIGLKDKTSPGNTNSDLCFGGVAIGENLTLDATELYNSGNPLCWERLSTDLQNKFTSFWALSNWDAGSTGNELTDRASSNNLTNNGSVLFNGTGLTVDCCNTAEAEAQYNTFLFDGTNDRISTNYASYVDLTAGMTANVWCKFTSNSNTSPFGNWNSTGWMLFISSTNQCRFYVNGSFTSSVAITTGQWIMLTATYDKTTMRLYEDGVEIATLANTATISQPSLGLPLELGAYAGGTSSFFDGSITSPILFNRALTPAEVSDLYQAGKTAYYETLPTSLTDDVVWAVEMSSRDNSLVELSGTGTPADKQGVANGGVTDNGDLQTFTPYT